MEQSAAQVVGLAPGVQLTALLHATEGQQHCPSPMCDRLYTVRTVY